MPKPTVAVRMLASLSSAGVRCEGMNPDGSMARGADVERFAREHDLVLISIAELVEWRREHERASTQDKPAAA